jgi:hypothetical protein
MMLSGKWMPTPVRIFFDISMSDQINILTLRINVLLDCVHRLRFHKTWISLRFGDWLCPLPQVYKIREGGRLKGKKG